MNEIQIQIQKYNSKEMFRSKFDCDELERISSNNSNPKLRISSIEYDEKCDAISATFTSKPRSQSIKRGTSQLLNPEIKMILNVNYQYLCKFQSSISHSFVKFPSESLEVNPIILLNLHTSSCCLSNNILKCSHHPSNRRGSSVKAISLLQSSFQCICRSSNDETIIFHQFHHPLNPFVKESI
jgi:hypothetical protein